MIDRAAINEMLGRKKEMKAFLSVCASCGFCADSCFLYRKHKKPEYMPSYKAISTLGRMFRRKRRINIHDLEDMRGLLWSNCVMCGRCYCPLGINIPGMISWARTICRTQGVYERYDIDSTGAGICTEED